MVVCIPNEMLFEFRELIIEEIVRKAQCGASGETLLDLVYVLRDVESEISKGVGNPVESVENDASDHN